MTNTSAEAKFKESFGMDLIRDAKVHLNVAQNVIIITEDKLRISLRDHVEELANRQKWITPVSLLVTLLIVFATSDFHDNFGVTGPTWQSFFMICFLLSFIWSIVCIVRAVRSKQTIEDLINQMKIDSESMKVNVSRSSTEEKILQIVDAKYGTDKNSIDVTEVLRTMVKNGMLKVRASNTIAGDPDRGKPKLLTIKYIFEGKVYLNEFKEGEDVVLPNKRYV